MKDNQKTCRNCKHRQRWQYGGSVFSYCGKIRSYRTQNGLKKIKASQTACLLYEKI